MMYDSKGQLREICWTCPCGQPHYSHKQKTCVRCKQEKLDTWTSVPGQVQVAPTNQDPMLQATLKNASIFLKAGILFEQEELKEGDMDVEAQQDAPPEPAAQLPPNKELEDAQATLEALRQLPAASKDVLEAAQAKVASLTPPPGNPSQELRDVAKLQQSRALLIDMRKRQAKKEEDSLKLLKQQLASLQVQIAEHEAEAVKSLKSFQELDDKHC